MTAICGYYRRFVDVGDGHLYVQRAEASPGISGHHRWFIHVVIVGVGVGLKVRRINEGEVTPAVYVEEAVVSANYRPFKGVPLRIGGPEPTHRTRAVLPEFRVLGPRNPHDHGRFVDVGDFNLNFNGVEEAVGVRGRDLYCLVGGSFIVQVYPCTQRNLAAAVDREGAARFYIQRVGQGIVVQVNGDHRGPYRRSLARVFIN